MAVGIVITFYEVYLSISYILIAVRMWFANKPKHIQPLKFPFHGTS